MILLRLVELTTLHLCAGLACLTYEYQSIGKPGLIDWQMVYGNALDSRYYKRL